MDSIKRDIRWLGFDWALERYASDYFDQLYDWAVVLIKKGLAYVDDQTQEEIRLTRGTVSEPGKESPWRNRSVEENLDLFERMKRANSPTAKRSSAPRSTWPTRTCCSATRSCTASCTPSITARVTNGASIRCTTMRTASAIRSSGSPTRSAPSNSTCTVRSTTGSSKRSTSSPSHQYEFARLNLTYTMMSKRKLLKLVQEGAVMGWDDPRMPTICALRRKGYTPASVRNFAEMVGVAKRDNVIDLGKLEFCVREDLNKVAERRMAVLNPLKVVITNYPEGKTELFTAINNPEDESAGTRQVPFSRDLYRTRRLHGGPAKKYYRLSPVRRCACATPT